jgi:hypothetical protein
MARKRMIYAELFEDEHFGSLSDKAKLLFIACIANADDDGRLPAHEANLRAYAFRYEEIPLNQIKEYIFEITETMKNFRYYEVGNSFYIEFSKWKEYQYIQNDRYKPSKIPTCIQPVSKPYPKCTLKSKEVKSNEVNLNQKKLNQTNGFDFSKQDNNELLNDIKAVIGESKHDGFWLKAIKELGEDRVRSELGELKYKIRTSEIKNPAGYLNKLLGELINER